MTKPFGYSYLLDMKRCAPGTANDLELHYRFLEELVNKLGMTRMSQPLVIHGPTDPNTRLEVFPEKAGVSGWVPLIESGIQIHSMEPTHEIFLDVFSCKEFEPGIVRDYAHYCFHFSAFNDHWIIRE